MSYVQSLFNEVGVSGLVDISIIALVLYGVLAWLKRTRRAALALTGLLIVAVIYLLAQQFGLRLTVAVLQGFFAIIVLALVVIFRDELRYLLERVAQFGMERGRWSRSAPALGREDVAVLVRTAHDLARERIGALIVLRGRDPLARHLNGGMSLEGRLSEALLKSLFDPHSIGHDGAVVLHGHRVESFGCHLPLSKSQPSPDGRGTRHAAAVGLSERADALCVVVSEERGAISVARHGELRSIAGPEALASTLERFYEETAPAKPSARTTRRFLTSNLREKLIAVTLSAALWFVMVHESRTSYETFRVPVEVVGSSNGTVVASVQPQEVEVTFSAPRKVFYLIRPAHIRLTLRTWGLEPGQRTITLDAGDLSFPKNLVFETVEPPRVDVRIERQP